MYGFAPPAAPRAEDNICAGKDNGIYTGKDSGFDRFPSRWLAIDQGWLKLARRGVDLLAWTKALLLHSDLCRS